MKHEKKPPAWLKRNPKNPRKLPERDEDLTPEQRDELVRLGENMRVRQINPIMCLPDGTILAGERRSRAAKLVGLVTVDVIIVEEKLTESQERAIAFAENALRADFSIWERFEAVREVVELNRGKTFKDVAGMLGLSAARVTQIMAPAKCLPLIQESLKAGELSEKEVIALSQAPQEEQPALLERLKAGAKIGEVKRQVKSKREEGKPTAKSASIRVPLSSGATVTVKGSEMSLEEAIEAMSDAVKLAKAALAKGITAKSAQSVWKDLAAAG